MPRPGANSGLNENDVDMGMSGPLITPDTNQLITFDKEGQGYFLLASSSNLGTNLASFCRETIERK
jgi:hypothetical protein